MAYERHMRDALNAWLQLYRSGTILDKFSPVSMCVATCGHALQLYTADVARHFCVARSMALLCSWIAWSVNPKPSQQLIMDAAVPGSTSVVPA